MEKKPRVKGAHYTIDFFGCDPHQLDSLEFWNEILPGSAHAAKMDILHSYYEKFEPQGITGFLLLSSSHISFHTWPEYNYVACDVFSCSNGDDTRRAVDFLRAHIEHKRLEMHCIKRGYVTMEYLVSPIYSTGEKEHIKVIKKIADITSPVQNIMVLDTNEHGRCLVIDDLVQTSELDHEIYDGAILEKLSPDNEHILILGGGDGYVAKTALKLNPDLKITIVDIDPEVIHVAKKFLNQEEVFSHPNVKIIVGDAVTYMETLVAKGDVHFDGIASDLTDNPGGSGETRREMRAFYSKLLSLSKQLLKPQGWFSAQAGASHVVRKYLDSVGLLSPIIEREFGNIERKDLMIPSFSESNAFLYARKQ